MSLDELIANYGCVGVAIGTFLESEPILIMGGMQRTAVILSCRGSWFVRLWVRSRAGGPRRVDWSVARKLTGFCSRDLLNELQPDAIPGAAEIYAALLAGSAASSHTPARLTLA